MKSAIPMKNVLLALFAVCFASYTTAQSLSQKIATAFRSFESHESLTYGTASLTVINANTNEVVFAKNEKTGLAPASTLKTITAATAYQILGPTHTFET